MAASDGQIAVRDTRAALRRELEALDPLLLQAEKEGDPVAAALREFIAAYLSNSADRLEMDAARLRLRHRLTVEARDASGFLKSAVIEPIL